MKNKYPLDLGLEEIIKSVNETCGEGTQFELIIRLLDNLMEWQKVNFNNDNERISYELNKSILYSLESSYIIYRKGSDLK